MANLSQAEIQAIITAGGTVTITSQAGQTYTYTTTGSVPSDAILATYRSVANIPAVVAGTTTLNFSTGTLKNIAQGAGNTTVALSSVPVEGFVVISVKQDGTGSRLVTWPSTVKWAAGTAPTLSTRCQQDRQFFIQSRWD